MVVKTDYCGLVSGRKEDKSVLFDIFSGELEGAPMISECPINMECRLSQTIELSTHDVFVGEVVGTYVNEVLIENGKIDISRLRPLLFDMSSRKYWSLGPEVARCWSVGNELKDR